MNALVVAAVVVVGHKGLDLGFPIAWQVRIPQRFCSVWCHGSILPLDASRKPTTSFVPTVTGREGRRVDESWLLFFFFAGLFSVSARRAAGVKSRNSLGPLTVAFLRVVAVGAFDVTPGTDDELGRVMTALCGIDVSRSRISNARRRGRKPEEMRECFGAIPAADEDFIGACTGRDSRCFEEF